MNADKSTSKKAAKSSKKSTGFSAEERAAMKEHAKELKAEAEKAAGESDVLAKIAEMPEADRVLAERIHALIKANAPMLSSKTWYGQPAYTKDGKIICFFQNASKFNTRYATLGFNHDAHLDDGGMWPVAFALKELNADIEARIIALLKKAVS